MKKNQFIQEDYPTNYDGYKFITLIQYNDNNLLTIVDNYDQDNVYAFVLDYCNQEGLNELDVVNICNEWFTTARHVPFSIFAQNHNLDIGRISRTFPANFITRLIGPVFKYNFQKSKKIRRRKIPSIGNIVVIKKLNK